MHALKSMVKQLLIGTAYIPVICAPLGLAKANEDHSADQLVCGPRAAKYILEHCDQQATLVELVKELQWPNIEDGSSLGDIDRLLVSRGLSTAYLYLNNEGPPEFDGMMIVARRTNSPLKHFVVVLHAKPQGFVEFIDGPEGIRKEPSAAFWANTDSGVLVVSEGDPIESWSMTYMIFIVTACIEMTFALGILLVMLVKKVGFRRFSFS